MSSGRGGARHFAKPLVDADVLFSILSANEELVADLGSYEHLSKAYAPDPKGLLHCLDLWKALVKAEPSGSCHMRPMRQALLSLLVKKPKLNTTTHSGEVWANLRVERLTCILMHVRKVKRDGLQALLAAKLSRDEMALVESGLQLLSLPPLENGGTSALGKASALEKAKSSSSLGFCFWKQKEKEAAGKEQWPFCGWFRFPQNVWQPRTAWESCQPVCQPKSCKDKKKGWAEASLEKVAKADKHLKESKCTKKEKGLGKDSSKKRQEWFKLYTTWPKCPERGYITGIHKEGDKKVLIVEVTKKNVTVLPRYCSRYPGCFGKGIHNKGRGSEHEVWAAACLQLCHLGLVP